MTDIQKVTLWTRARARRVAKREKVDARWTPYSTRRVAAEKRVSGFVADMTGDYRFYTALCFAMAVAGFFWMQFMEVVALVGGVAMWQHWGRALGTPEQFKIPCFGLWRALSLVTIPVAAAGCAFMLFSLASGFVAGS